MELEAKGTAASILEDGQARVRVLRDMIDAYEGAAGAGDRVFVLNMLPEIVRELAQTVDKVTVDRVSVVDSGGNGHAGGLGRFVTQFPAAVVALAEQIETATGVDVLAALRTKAGAPASGGVPATTGGPSAAPPPPGPSLPEAAPAA
jgi:flotillin